MLDQLTLVFYLEMEIFESSLLIVSICFSFSSLVSGFRTGITGMIAFNRRKKLKRTCWASTRQRWEGKGHWLMHTRIRYSDHNLMLNLCKDTNKKWTHPWKLNLWFIWMMWWWSYVHLQQNWKNNSKSANPMFMDPSNPTWGWSWLERWMAGRPLESCEKEQNNDNGSVKSSINRNEATKSAVRNNSTQPNTPSSARGTPRNKNGFFSPPTPSRLNQSARKSNDDDAKSTISVLSERNRRHSIAGSSVRDDESLAGSPALPSYMVPTKSARARLKPQSPLSGTTQENDGFADKASAKKRLAYPTSPALPKPQRRFSAPPKVESGGVAVTNGGGSWGIYYRLIDIFIFPLVRERLLSVCYVFPFSW